ncbi:MAG TPA: cation:proton antiporter [Bryobacteraceae bacterium]|nr:cation:proton antiporter [Bryobacteraceae bacterium]
MGAPFAIAPAAPPCFIAAEHHLSIPLAMLLVFGSAKLLAELFERAGQPGIVGEILAGIVIGPSVFGWIAPNELLHALSELGVMFLLFRVGLEVKPSELVQVGGTALMVAVLGVALPFVLGWAIMAAWGYPRVESIFVGAAMVATSVGITAQVLAAKGLLQLRASRIILGAAVIDDILGLLVLAIVSGFATGRVNVLDITLTATAALGTTALVATLGTRTMRRIVPRLSQSLRAGEVQFNVALVLLFALALLATYARMAAIIGAFLAGMALAESVSTRVNDLSAGVAELLVPFFLVGIGLQVDLGAVASPSLMILAAAVLIAAVASKWIGCGIAAAPLGWTEAMRIGVGMVPRGEVGMVVAQIGLSMGVIEKSVYGVVVFMAVATTLIAPPLLKMFYRGVRPIAVEERFQIG